MAQPSDASLRQIRYFAALAEDLHFGQAASRLGISQPALTRQIQKLEEHVGVALAERSQRSVSLTEAGAAFADAARETLDQHGRSLQAAGNVAARAAESLAIGFESCAPFHGLPSMLSRFLARYPNTRLGSFELPGPEQVEGLIRRRIDLGFVHPPVPDGPMFQFDAVGEERFVAAVPASDRLARSRRAAVADLAAERYTLYPRTLAPGCYAAVQRICQLAGFSPKVVHESNGVSVSLRLIPSVGAVTLFPECVAARPVAGVAFRPLTGSVTTVTCGFLRRAGRGAAPVERFLGLWRSGTEARSKVR